eukprot:scaffold146299_cov39-Tisochrysis_lutea.AAC.7
MAWGAAPIPVATGTAAPDAGAATAAEVSSAGAVTAGAAADSLATAVGTVGIVAAMKSPRPGTSETARSRSPCCVKAKVFGCCADAKDCGGAMVGCTACIVGCGGGGSTGVSSRRQWSFASVPRWQWPFASVLVGTAETCMASPSLACGARLVGGSADTATADGAERRSAASAWCPLSAASSAGVLPFKFRADVLAPR